MGLDPGKGIADNGEAIQPVEQRPAYVIQIDVIARPQMGKPWRPRPGLRCFRLCEAEKQPAVPVEGEIDVSQERLLDALPASFGNMNKKHPMPEADHGLTPISGGKRAGSAVLVEHNGSWFPELSWRCEVALTQSHWSVAVMQ